MKTPAFLGAALESLRRATAGIAAAVSRIAARAKPAGAPDRRPIMIAAAAVACALLLLLIVLAAGGARRAEPERVVRTVRGLPYDFPASGSRLLGKLIMPGPAIGELPFPLAREPKSRYTDAQAAAARPDLGSLDLTEFHQ